MDSKSKDPININTDTVAKLIRIFEQQKELSDSKEQSCAFNRKSAFMKIPQTLLLSKICSYLEEKDIIALSAVSALLRRTFYSPLGLKLLINARNKQIVVHRQYKGPEAENRGEDASHGPAVTRSNTSSLSDYNSGEKMQKMWKSMEGEDLIAELSTMKSVNEFLTNRVKECEEKNERHQKEIEETKNQLRIQKRIDEKKAARIKMLEEKIKNYESEVNDHKETIKDINQRYQKFITEKEGELSMANNEKKKIQTQKKVLVSEVKKLREEIESLQSNEVKYKNALKIIKSAFVNSEIYSKVSSSSGATE